MKGMTGMRFICLAMLSLALLTAGCASLGGGAGLRSSDPQLTGPRDMNYDHLIIPGQRIGPVQMGGFVSEAVRHLGNPDHVYRSTFRGPGYYADEVYYNYNDECIRFTWMDSGIDPRVESGWRGINVTCGKWSTPDGLHVGSSMRDVANHIGEYCPSTRKDGTLLIATKQGIWFFAKDRNSPVFEISVVPVSNNWGGMCKD